MERLDTDKITGWRRVCGRAVWGWMVSVADPLAKWAQILAIAGAAWWAVYTFNLFGTSTVSPTVKVSTSVLPYDAGHALLVVRVKTANPGKVPVDVRDEPMSITIKEVPANRAAGYVDRDDLKPLYLAKNIIGRYTGGYEIDPAVEFDEVEPFVVEVGKTYIVEATLTLDKTEDVRTPEVVHVPANTSVTGPKGQ